MDNSREINFPDHFLERIRNTCNGVFNAHYFSIEFKI